MTSNPIREKLFPKGSEWRKWDLHVHTPASVLNANFGTDWDIYVKNLFKTLIEKEIYVVGITDYFTIDGYKKLKEVYLSDDEKLNLLFSDREIEKIKSILVLPNIEFRSDIFVGSKSVNFHILFSEDISEKDIEENFLHEINFVYQGDPQEPDKKRKLREVNLIDLGKRLKSEHEEFNKYSDLYVGMMNAVVDHKEVSKILYDKENIFGGKYLFVTMADEDLSSISWDSRDHLTRKVLIQKSDLLFSSNPKTIKWGLGISPYTEGVDNFIKEFKTLKPCIHGSDAHEYKFIGHPCSKRGDKSHDCSSGTHDCELRYTWILADTTFEGLKQILYEPEDRVAIQESDPTPYKSAQTITYFGIKASKLETELAFLDISLPLNEVFIAVTGGRGSGKTAFVDVIANMYEDRAGCDDKNSFIRRVSENKDSKELETILKLKNENEYKKEIKQPIFIDEASIVYVAQGELEKHVEDPAHLESYINDLIFESNEIRDSELLFDYKDLNDEISEFIEDIHLLNKTIFNTEKETDVNIESGFQKDIKSLTTNLNDTQKRIEILAKNLSRDKIKASEEKQEQLTKLRDKKEQLIELGITIKEALKFVDEDLVSFNRLITKINSIANKLAFTHEFKSIEYKDAEKLRSFITIVRTELKKNIADIEKFQKDLEEKEKGIKEHSKLLDKKKEIEKSIKQIENKLKVIGDKKRELKEDIKKRNKLYEQLLNKRLEQRKKYLEIIAKFSKNKSDILNDIEFVSELIFDRDRFIDTMAEIVDLRRIKIKTAVYEDSEITFFTDAMLDLARDPSEEKVKTIAGEKIEELLKMILQNQKRAESINRQTIYNLVFGDYLSVIPSVKYKKVKISKLSLGQKATVLIKIYLAQGENPILIDSHDDHLDNEFIMDELVKAIRQAKQHRQIILVSNNGNVVVNSDAEQVVIANRNDKGEISYVAGSLENQTLRQRILGVLEGGKEAFSKRQKKYRLNR